MAPGPAELMAFDVGLRSPSTEVLVRVGQVLLGEAQPSVVEEPRVPSGVGSLRCHLSSR